MSREIDGTPQRAPGPDSQGSARSAFSLILARLGRRDHTERELRKALARKGFPEDAVERAISRAKREGLVNDERLAAALARSTASAGRRGPRRVIAALRQKGIDRKTAQSAAREAFAASEQSEARLVVLAGGLLQRARGETPKLKRVKVLRSLIGRGFEPGDARRALGIAETDFMAENSGDDASE